MRYLLDTNVLSEPLYASPNHAVLKRLQRHEGEFATASIVLHELYFGAARLGESGKRRVIERFIEEVVVATIPILPYDAQAAGWHALERARLARQGKTPPFADGQIAAIAKVHQLVLVTNNLADFKYFKGLVLENWHAGKS